MRDDVLRDANQAAAAAESLKPSPNTALKAVLVVWMLSYTSAALILILEGWLRNYGLLRQCFGVANDQEISINAVAAIHTLLGGVLGGGTLGMVSFHKHVSVEQNFNVSHAWGYIFAPWLAGILGLLVFALLRVGLLVFSGVTTAQSDTAPIGFLAIGFLSGFGWDHAIRRIRIIVKQFFSEADLSSKVPPSTASGEEVAEVASDRIPDKSATSDPEADSI